MDPQLAHIGLSVFHLVHGPVRLHDVEVLIAGRRGIEPALVVHLKAFHALVQLDGPFAAEGLGVAHQEIAFQNVAVQVAFLMQHVEPSVFPHGALDAESVALFHGVGELHQRRRKVHVLVAERLGGNLFQQHRAGRGSAEHREKDRE